MVDYSLLVTLGVGLASSVVGVLLGYIFALRAARKQRRHEVKEEAYGRMFPKIQESIEILGEIQAVAGLELGKDETPENLVERLSQPLWILGLSDAMPEMRGYLNDSSGTKQAPELFAKIQKAVYARLLSEFYRNLRDLRYDVGALEFTAPSPDVKTKLDTALRAMLVSMFGLGPIFSKLFEGSAAASKHALEQLKGAMREDLKRTL